MASTSNANTVFDLHGEDFHKLSKLEAPNNKRFLIKICNKIFHLTKEETYLLSPKCYSLILKISFSFSITLPSNQKSKYFNKDDLIQAFEQLYLLFSTRIQILINQSNVHVFKYLSKVLENEYLRIECEHFLNGESSNTCFMFSSKMLLERSARIKKSLYDFTIFVNNIKIKCNKAFCCCLSQTIFQVVLNDSSVEEFHFKISKMNIFLFLYLILCVEKFFKQLFIHKKKFMNAFV
jgi:hypothetical protein